MNFRAMVTICQSPNLLRYLLIFKDHILVLDYSRCTDFRRKILTFQSIHNYVCIRNISYNSFTDERNGGYPLMFSWTKDVLYIIYFATILHTGLDILEMVQFGGIRQVYLKFLLWSSSVASLQAPQIFQKVYYTWSVMSN